MLAMPEASPTATITVRTIHGALEVPEHRLVTFVAPLLGFERLKRFHIHQTQPGPMFWLQSVEEQNVAFCLLAPFLTKLDPDMEIAPADVAEIGARSPDEIEVYTITVLDPDPAKIRTNLRAPILVCRRTGLAKQVVLANGRLPIKCYLRELAGRPS